MALLIKVFAIFAVILVSGCTSGYLAANPNLEGPFLVTKVIDGDTIALNNTERVRLSGIDTPERGVCYYKEAKEKLSNLTFQKEVYLENDLTNRDKYKRLLRYIYVNNTNANFILVQEGYGQVYDKYSYDTKYYLKLKEIEAPAKEQKLGLWNCENLTDK
ncbi:TPA: thermonuclease family protein [archaeon]|nr:thermonuclease family protein [Candidatus Naiadarchaeales archaeon SRR2090153.bin461]HIK02746.1 thermonuclease family protein [Candidatus Naiadarchaeales archaeon SRR2090159.bin1288]